MTGPVQIAHPPDRPLMIYDADCNFCIFWIRRWQQVTGERVKYLPFQDPTIPSRFPEIPRSQFQTAVQLIEPDGRVFQGAEAVFRSLAQNPARKWPLQIYQAVPGVATASDLAYRLVARNRMFFSFLTRLLWGRKPEMPGYQRVRWIFLRCLGLVYLAAFVSLWVQIQGLMGSKGILPAAEYMAQAGRYFDQEQIGWARYHLLPTWCWLSATDGFLNLLCAAGTGLAALLVCGVASPLCALLLWTLYLSLTAVGGEFLSFQWDALLLETGFLAIFFAPWRLWERASDGAPVSRTALWLLRWLLFRLMFESGCVKLLSGDPAWRQLAALQYHYETQPLPTWIGWFAHLNPEWFQKGCVLIMFGIELALPFFIFGPRRLRAIAATGIILLQLWILLTGNYGFFNYLTIALSLLLLDDSMTRAILPFGRRAARDPALPVPNGSAAAAAGAGLAPARRLGWPRWTMGLLLVTLLPVSTLELAAVFHWHPGWARPVGELAGWLEPFRSINNYGLFAVMTTTRPEIVIEGSNDRQTWRAYEFKYKPGVQARRPAFVAPHQPRLDWQMWFAALGTYRENRWLVSFCVRLLQGSPEVLRLLQANPFPDKPPRFIRAVTYQYHFTNFQEWRRTGAWWKREPAGEYLPILGLKGASDPNGP